MKEEDRILLLFGWSALMILLIALTCKVCYNMDQLNKKLDILTERIVTAASVPEAGTVTDATPTDATPTEPPESQLSISINPEYITSENVQETQEEASPSEPKEIVTEGPKAVPETSEEVTEVLSEASESPEVVEEVGDPTGLSYLGTYELTAYAWTGNPCANGNYPQVGYTVASNSIPMGSRILIEGYGEYVVEDCGGMAGNVIDVYMGDYDTCIQFGRRTAEVYLIE